MNATVWLVPLVLGLAAAGSEGRPAEPRPAREEQVRALVRQLGHPEFRQREEAQQALVRLGTEVLPLIEKLGPQADAEVRQRLGQVRRELVGYLDDMRAGLAALPPIEGENRIPIPDDLKQTIEGNQPRSGNFLLTIIADPGNRLHRPAANTFVQTWNSMSTAQIDTFLRHTFILKARPRPRYPQGIDAGIAFVYQPRYSYGSWPPQGRFTITTHTRHFLDGRPYGKPFAYQGPMACTGWVWTKDLSLGRHTCALELEYTFTHQGHKQTGSLRSRDFAFTMVPADTPDDLVASADPATDRLVSTALRFTDHDPTQSNLPRGPFAPPVAEVRRPQITWAGPKGTRCGIAVPCWQVTQALPVDLCFEVVLREEKTGKVHPCDPLVLRRGAAHMGYFCPRDAVGFARGRTGTVGVKVVLKPSRKVALTSTEVTRYFPGSLTSGVLTVEVFEKEPPLPTRP